MPVLRTGRARCETENFTLARIPPGRGFLPGEDAVTPSCEDAVTPSNLGPPECLA
jgi:hypothetical protein